jgi:hypothetical protein
MNHSPATSGMGPPLLLQATPGQRLLVQGVLSLTGQIVRSVGTGGPAGRLDVLVEERHRMLRELGECVTDEAAIGCLAALTAAVIESDLALEAIQQDS